MDFSKTIIRRLAPAAAALVVFFVVSAAYFAPQFRGEVLPQHDVVQYEGMAKDISDMRAATGEDPQWTGGMFGGHARLFDQRGLPRADRQAHRGTGRETHRHARGLPLLRHDCHVADAARLRRRPWVGIVPALAYGLSTYFLLIIGAGHITKMWALVYAPLMIGRVRG